MFVFRLCALGHACAGWCLRLLRRRRRPVLIQCLPRTAHLQEDHLFADKTEKFVTRAYKEKLAADKKWEEEDAAREAAEQAKAKKALEEGGVDASVNFYSNLLRGAFPPFFFASPR